MAVGVRDIAALTCAGETLLASFDGPPDARVGWLFVVGGTQTRVGPHRLYERLALRLAETGHAVVRYDRRGVGDSSGDDPGYQAQGPEMDAATGALRSRFSKLDRIFAFGLCDGATAIAFAAPRIDGAVLANPWVVEPAGDLPPAAAIRGHYRRRLTDLRAWRRLFTGQIDIRRLFRGVLASRRFEDTPPARRFAGAIPRGSRIALAEGDGTAQAFRSAWNSLGDSRPDTTIVTVATASHSFADTLAFEALAAAMLDYAAATASSASKSTSAR